MKFIIFYEINHGEYQLSMEIQADKFEKIDKRTIKVNGALIELEDAIIVDIKKI
jgi:hypothetical protein